MAELIHSVVTAPVVSSQSDSPEAKLARDAKMVQVQSSIDSKYDTVLNRNGVRESPDPSTFLESF